MTGGIKGRDDTAKVWKRGSQVETEVVKKNALKDAGPHIHGTIHDGGLGSADTTTEQHGQRHPQSRTR